MRARSSQPLKREVSAFFAGRIYECSLETAVRDGMERARAAGQLFMWLCVTNSGADRVNRAALLCSGLSADDIAAGFLGDPKVASLPIVARLGLTIRLTRNLDKDRGFVNGAVGTIVWVFDDCIFAIELSSGVRLLVHPICAGDSAPFLPATYGYATTIRRAQGATLDHGCLWFDHCYPPERGYGYVAVSRFRSHAGVFHYGPVRRTDWLPVGGEADDEQLYRGLSSESDAENPCEDFETESDAESLCPPEYAMCGSNDFYSGTAGSDSAMDVGAESDTSSISDDGAASAFETDNEFLSDAITGGAPDVLAESVSEALLELLRQ